jgi:phosphoribosylamine--glycine ligase
VFHAGTALREGHLVTSGGRVLGVAAVAPTLQEAVSKAYEGKRAGASGFPRQGCF